AETNDRYAELRKLLSTPPRAGTNLAIASHGNPFRAVTDTTYLAEGEPAVIRPLGAQGFRIVARIPKDGWAALTAPYIRPPPYAACRFQTVSSPRTGASGFRR